MIFLAILYIKLGCKLAEVIKGTCGMAGINRDLHRWASPYGFMVQVVIAMALG